MNFDWAVLHWIRHNMSCAFFDSLFLTCSRIGDFGAVWIVSAILLLCGKKYRKTGILLLIALALGFLIGNVLLKNVIARDRPCWLEPGVPLLIATPKDYSFPSGHALASFIGATVLTLANRKFALFSVPLSVLIAFSRLYLYVHFPTDLFASLAIGISIGVFVHFSGNFASVKIAAKKPGHKTEIEKKP